MLPAKNKLADEKTPIKKRRQFSKKDMHFEASKQTFWYFLFCQGFIFWSKKKGLT